MRTAQAPASELRDPFDGAGHTALLPLRTRVVAASALAAFGALAACLIPWLFSLHGNTDARGQVIIWAVGAAPAAAIGIVASTRLRRPTVVPLLGLLVAGAALLVQFIVLISSAE
jgi:hypothetical protein